MRRKFRKTYLKKLYCDGCTWRSYTGGQVILDKNGGDEPNAEGSAHAWFGIDGVLGGQWGEENNLRNIQVVKSVNIQVVKF